MFVDDFAHPFFRKFGQDSFPCSSRVEIDLLSDPRFGLYGVFPNVVIDMKALPVFFPDELNPFTSIANQLIDRFFNNKESVYLISRVNPAIKKAEPDPILVTFLDQISQLIQRC